MFNECAQFGKHLSAIGIVEEYARRLGRERRQHLPKHAGFDGRDRDRLGNLCKSDAIDCGIEQRRKIADDQRPLNEDFKRLALVDQTPRR